MSTSVVVDGFAIELNLCHVEEMYVINLTLASRVAAMLHTIGRSINRYSRFMHIRLLS